MKRKILNISIVFVFATSSSYTMPVVDGAQVEESILTAARWVDQGLAWKREIDQWKAKMKALKDFRLDGNILNKFTELNNLLGEYGLDMGDLDLNNPKSEIGLYAKQLFDSYSIFDDCAYDYMTDNQKKICQNRMVRSVQEIATMTKMSNNVTELVNKLNTLNDKLAHAEDIKSSQDISAGIKATIASMSALKTQYEIMVIKNKAMEKLEQRQTEQIQAKKRENSISFIRKY